MKRNYTFFNVASLFAILLSVFLLIATFQTSTDSAVHFEDPGLEQAVRDTIGKEEGSIEPSDVDLVQELDASGYGIESLEGIETLRELRTLNLEDNSIESVVPLQTLTKLEVLNLRNNGITSLEDIQFDDIIFLDIQELNLRHNVVRDEEGNETRLSDVSLLAHLTTLEELDLRDNHIEEISPLSNLRDLEQLDLRENRLHDIEALETLTLLEELNLRENDIVSLEPLRYLTRLTYLNIHSNSGIESLEPLSELINLETLIIRNVPITDNGVFLNKLTNLQRLNVIDSNVETINPDIIDYLRSRGALSGEVRPERLLHTLEAPAVGRESGFYTEGFDLKIKAPSEEGTIYYTLDGSEPTMDSAIYEEPIEMTPKADESMTIVRAKVLTDDHKMSKTVSKSYLVHENANERFDLPVFSLVTDPAHLFDEDIGIYTDENAHNRGSEWERPVHIDFFETDGELALEQELGVRIHGGHTRSYPQKSLRLLADDEYDTEQTLNYDFFNGLEKMNGEGTVTEFKRLLLRNSGNDWQFTMYNDALMQSLVEPLGTMDTQAYRPAVLFMNGDYYGIQNIRERYDRYYLSTHYDMNPEDVVILQNNAELDDGESKDVYHYTNMLDYIAENGLEEEEHFEYIQTVMDTENFRDYFAVQIYFANTDWPHGNIRYWRKTTDSYEKDAPYGHDGRWRWMLFDTDHGFNLYGDPHRGTDYIRDYTHNTIEWLLDESRQNDSVGQWSTFLFREVIANEQFRIDFLNRMNDLINSIFIEEVVDQKIDGFVRTLEKEMPHHIDRWGVIGSMEEWLAEVEDQQAFAEKRPENIRTHLMNQFGIEETIKVRVENETERGYVRLNTIEITSELPGNTGESPWSGTYFAGVPITFEAVPKEGYEFSHWAGLPLQEGQIELTPSTDLTIQAVFTPTSE